MSAGWVAEVPSVENVDVAEIEPLVAEIARLAELANFRVLDNPKVHLFRGDGREFLLTTDKRYDIIASEPSNPFRSGIASLFTREFYETVERHLTETGIFAQWLQGYEVDAYTVRMTLATLHSVFPAVEAWQTESSDFLLLATRKAARARHRSSAAPRVGSPLPERARTGLVRRRRRGDFCAFRRARRVDSSRRCFAQW